MDDSLKKILRLAFFIVIFCVSATVFFLLRANNVQAIGISPPQFDIGTIPVGSMQTVGLWIIRSATEDIGDLTINVSARKSGQSYFQGSPQLIITSGTDKVWYSFNIVPDFSSEGPFELFVDFLLPASGDSGTIGNSVITGATAVALFSTGVIPSVGTVSSGGSSSGGTSGTSNDSSQEETAQEDTTTDNSQNSEQQTTTQEIPQPDSGAPEESPVSTTTGKENSLDTKSTSDAKIVNDNTQGTNEISQKPSEIKQPSETTKDLGPQTSDSLISPVSMILKDNTYFASSYIVLTFETQGIRSASIYKYILNTQQDATLDDLVSETRFPQATFTLDDGIYYFHIARETADGIGEIITQRLVIDTKPPNIQANLETKKQSWFSFSNHALSIEVSDQLSGVGDYTVALGAQQLNKTKIEIPSLKFGTYSFLVDATDLAGNIVQKTVVVHVVPKYPLPKFISQFLRIFSL